MCLLSCFFFSSRRRHTRWPRDWSSDVCSSDLLLEHVGRESIPAVTEALKDSPLDVGDPEGIVFAGWWAESDPMAAYKWAVNHWRAGCATIIASVFRVWAHSNPQEALENSGK